MSKQTVNHYLACVGEECGEIQQEISKALRFGVDDVNPKTKEKNIVAVLREFNDLCGAMTKLFDCEIGELIVKELIKEKQERIEKWLKYAEKADSNQLKSE